MLDPKKFQAFIASGTKSAQAAQQELLAPFLHGIETMELSGADTARTIINNVNQTCKQMLDEMNSVFSGLQENVDAHQKMQKEERPKDFDSAMRDLRDTLATGFPQEMKQLFDKLPKI